MARMRIACIGWGSLLWDPRGLPMAGPFRLDGPRLPIEFSRVSADGRVTLVIDPEARPITTAWSLLASESLEAAIEGLGRRERVAPARWGDWIAAQASGEVDSHAGEALAETRRAIEHWLGSQSLDAAVWTALPARRPDGGMGKASTEELVSHLRELDGFALGRAEEYIRRAPGFIRTPRRERFEAEFGWALLDVPPNPATPGVLEEPA